MNNSHFAAMGSMNSINPQSTKEVVAEGRNIKLTCKYEGSIYNIQWYRQYQRSRPEFLLLITETGSIHPPDSDFSAHIDKTEKRVDLEIISAKVSDSAVYYCALQPKVTGNTTTLYKNLWSKDNITQFHPQTTNIVNMLSLKYCVHHLLLLFILKGVSCEDLTPVKSEEFTLEGSNVPLSYKYSRQATANDEFYWYRQYPGKPPEFLISHSGTGSVIKTTVSTLSVNISGDKTQLNLQISSAAVSDSAVYYCAVRPTVTGNTTTLYKNLWSKDNTILHNIH
ncbi:uncharacterized protein [Channa argus]|uniref:uncharacterized protein n=1 Tax=Channa argus TaxID=215402 RepID=UPI0035223F48